MNDTTISVGQVFTPGSPVNERDLFSGRIEQYENVLNAVTQKGYHAVLYGERGVGKTSLANIISTSLEVRGPWIVRRVTCDAGDTYSSLWRKAFDDLTFAAPKPGMGFDAQDTEETKSFLSTLPEELTPDIVRRTLALFAKQKIVLIVFDEFDRLRDENATLLMSDTIKVLSDYGVGATILLIGVADSVEDLVAGHRSIERALVQIPMPRMSKAEIKEIVTKGVERLAMTVSSEALDEIASLSQGLPYITHLLSLYSVRAALPDEKGKIETAHVDVGMRAALDQWQQSIKTAYYTATKSQQPGNIFKEVLLACAVAEVDELGYFTAASVRSPLRTITKKTYDIPNFARHLKELSEEGRGGMLQRTGEKRRIRYRFVSPIMRPYIVMKGFADKLITKAELRSLTG